jgi:FMN phosphatase YigB (HAD superfamily)
MSKKLDELTMRVQDTKIKVVSFDIFDTLLLRPTVRPTDIFRLVGRKTNYSPAQFMEMRRLAEVETRKRRPYGIDDITLDDIYQTFSNIYAVDIEEAERIKQIELDTEFKFLYPRKSLQHLFCKALDAGKEVILVSDMYLPKDFIEKVLKKNGYTGYSELFLSCEHGMSKGSGKLFQKIISIFSEKGIGSGEILHIGDNLGADVRIPRKHGIHSEYAPNAINIFKSKRGLSYLTNSRDNDNSFLTGLIANTMFDDPYISHDPKRTINGRLENLALLVSPILFSFTKWMLEDALSSKVDKILLTWRDGYLPEKIINILRNHYDVPQLERIYLTRAMRYPFYSEYPSGLSKGAVDMPINSNMSVSEFIRHRVLIVDEKETDEVLGLLSKGGYLSTTDKIGNMDRYFPLLGELEPYFKRNSEEHISTVLDYCRHTIGSAENIAIFDVGYSGTVNKFLLNRLNVKSIGYHMLSTPSLNIDSKDLDLRSFIQYGFETRIRSKILHTLFEDIISEQTPTAMSVSKKDGFTIIKDPDAEDEQIDENIEMMQKVILKFCSDFVDLFEEDVRLLEFEHYANFEVLVGILLNPNKEDAGAIRKMNFKDSSFIVGSESDYYKKWYLEHFPNTVRSGNVRQRIYTAISSKAVILLKKMNLYDKAMIYYNKTCRVFPRLMNPRYESDVKFIKILEEEIKNSLSEIQNSDILKKSSVLFFGDFLGFDRGVCNYIANLQYCLGKEIVSVISDSNAPADIQRNKIRTPVVFVPSVFKWAGYPKHHEMKVTKEIRLQLQNKRYLEYTVKNWRGRFNDESRGRPEILAVMAYEYFSKLIQYIQPKKIVLWNGYKGLNHLIKCVAEDMGIDVLYMESGVIPGTFALEKYRGMGESWPAIHYSDFVELNVSEYEIENAKAVLEYLRSNDVNRYEQSKSWNTDSLVAGLKTDRPTVFYAGQFDFDSGLFPYTERTEKFNSPTFTSSDDAARFLSGLCKKNNWNFVYKPHPQMVLNGHADDIKGAHMVKKGNVNDLVDMSDVTVTILSQMGYVSSIRNKATVMLGYNQLRGKSCTYEAFRKEDIEPAIIDAIKNGQTDDMRSNLIKHIAQMLKYYLSDDMLPRKMRYGRTVHETSAILSDESDRR